MYQIIRKKMLSLILFEVSESGWINHDIKIFSSTVYMYFMLGQFSSSKMAMDLTYEFLI